MDVDFEWLRRRMQLGGQLIGELKWARDKEKVWYLVCSGLVIYNRALTEDEIKALYTQDVEK